MKPSNPKNNEIILKEHTYDGIQEYDQKLPNWWLFTLYIMIVWFIFGWVAYYQLPFEIPDDQNRIETKMAMIESRKQEELESMMASISNESLQEMSLESAHINAGKSIFEAKCIACHGQDLSAKMGGIQLPGVALNDEEWLYGSEPLNIMEIVTNGSPDVTKGMIAWNSQLSPAEIAQVVAYILSHQSS